jgi:CRISPR-associated protein Csb1
MSLTYKQLLAFVTAYAGIRAVTDLEPLGGPGSKVFPPTYGVDERAPITRYAVEERVITDGDGAEVRRAESVVLNSVAAQAHAFSGALLSAREAGELDLPLVGVDFTRSPGVEEFGVITDLQCPHRVYDAIIRDSLEGEGGQIAPGPSKSAARSSRSRRAPTPPAAEQSGGVLFRYGPIGQGVTRASTRNATALYRHAPSALLFGAWDSTGPRGARGSRFERAITSEIVATDIALGKTTSSRIDPLGIEKDVVPIYRTADSGWTLDKKEAVKTTTLRPSEINHGNIRPSINFTAGGVTARAIQATTVLSLIQLRRLQFPEDADGNSFEGNARAKASDAARATLAALGLAATALAFEAGFDLRSRCVLAPTSDLRFEAVGRSGEINEFSLTGQQALELVGQSARSAAAAGLPWRVGLHTLTPTDRLADLVRLSREAAEQSHIVEAAEQPHILEE